MYNMHLYFWIQKLKYQVFLYIMLQTNIAFEIASVNSSLLYKKEKFSLFRPLNMFFVLYTP